MTSQAFQSDKLRQAAFHPFPATYSARVALYNRPSLANTLLMGAGALLMDGPAWMRGAMINHVVSDAPPLANPAGGSRCRHALCLQQRDEQLARVRHVPNGPHRRSRRVTDSNAAVQGVSGLYVADASIMPFVTRNNTNLPTIMIGEKVADLLQQRLAA